MESTAPSARLCLNPFRGALRTQDTMGSPRGAAVFVFIFAAAAAFARPQAGRADPYVPASDSVVLERLPTSPLDPAARRLRAMRTQLTERPDNLALAAQLARLYIEQGRALSDP